MSSQYSLVTLWWNYGIRSWHAVLLIMPAISQAIILYQVISLSQLFFASYERYPCFLTIDSNVSYGSENGFGMLHNPPFVSTERWKERVFLTVCPWFFWENKSGSSLYAWCVSDILPISVTCVCRLAAETVRRLRIAIRQSFVSTGGYFLGEWSIIIFFPKFRGVVYTDNH